MRINYKNTALNLLDKWDEEINIPKAHVSMTKVEELKFGRSVCENLSKGKEMFSNKIQLVSASFMEAYHRGRHKLINVFDKEPIEDCGTFVYQFGGGWTKTVFYYLKTFGCGEDWHVDYLYIEFSKHRDNDFKSIDVCVSGVGEEEKTFIWEGHYKEGCDHTYYMSFLVTFLCFIKHVDLETKMLKPNQKEKHAGVKYLNETKSNVEILDSTWFTTLVRSDGFHVRGHFRLQPCGEGLKDRKLIWISDFDKNGYTRKAKMLMND